MEIKDHETPSAIFAGIKGAAEWAAKQGAGIVSWFKDRILDAGNLLRAIKNGALNALKSGWNFLTNWFSKDPVRAVAGVAAGVLVAGVLVVSGGAIIGAIGGGIAALTASAGSMVAGAGALLVGGGLVVGLAQFAVRGLANIYNFNWAQSDKSILEAQKGLFNNLVIAAGGQLGQAMGALVCGVTPGVAQIEVDVGLMAKLWTVLDENTKDEILDAWAGLISMTRQAASQAAFLEVYKNARSWIRNNIRTGIPGIDKAIAAWGTEENKTWSFASAIEEWTESFDNKVLGQAIQEAIEEGVESCVAQLQLKVRYS